MVSESSSRLTSVRPRLMECKSSLSPFIMIADMDLMIASIAIANDATLVTNNFKHFDRVKNFTLVQWVESEK